jgi:hypothetical protein
VAVVAGGLHRAGRIAAGAEAERAPRAARVPECAAARELPHVARPSGGLAAQGPLGVVHLACRRGSVPAISARAGSLPAPRHESGALTGRVRPTGGAAAEEPFRSTAVSDDL